jgi:hypothetical protein
MLGLAILRWTGTANSGNEGCKTIESLIILLKIYLSWGLGTDCMKNYLK